MFVVTIKTKNFDDWAVNLFHESSRHEAVLYARRLANQVKDVRLRRIMNPNQIEQAQFMIEKMDDWAGD